MNYERTLASVEERSAIVGTFVTAMADLPVVLIGVGKSFIMAQLGASLLQSVSVNATAIHAVDFMHGSMGHLRGENAVIIALSHSGTTREVADALRAVRWAQTAVITSGRSTVVTMSAGTVFHYTCDTDGSMHGTIPAVSLMGQLAWLNAIVCEIADRLDVDELAANHPCGSLARKYGVM